MERSLSNCIRPLVKRFFGKKSLAGKTTEGPEPPGILEELRLARDRSVAYWGDLLLPVKGKHFDILYKLAERPEQVISHQELFSLIKSKRHRETLLRQYINNIRKSFPAPYNDPRHPKGIIKTRKMKGYYLNLSPDKVDIT